MRAPTASDDDGVKLPSGERPVIRKQLLTRIGGGQRLVFLQAPAGHGKTTLMQQLRSNWNHEGVTTDWLTLDDGDNDTSRILAQLRALLQRLEAQSGPLVDATKKSLQISSERAPRSDWFVERLADCQDRIAVFLDEFQVIKNRSILSFFRSLLERIPENVTFVIGSRTVPDIGLARLSVSGQATIFRAQDLRFSIAEAEDFFSSAESTELSRQELLSIYERSEGWPAALQLYRLSLPSPNVRRSLRDIGNFRPKELADYLADNVIDLQPEAIQVFLRETALLKRISAPLCDSVTGRKDSQKLLNHLERAGLFLRSLDSENCWFKYHTLFSGFLARQLQDLNPDRALTVHSTAANWFFTQEDFDAAMHHAVAAGDLHLGAEILDRWAERLIMDGDLTTVERWFDRLPLTVVEERPSLVVKIAYALAFLRRRQKLEPLQKILEKYARSSDEELVEQAAVIRSMILVIQDNISGAASVVRTIRLDKDTPNEFRAFELGAGANLEGFLAIAAGDPERAHEFLALGRAYSERASAAFSWGYAVSTFSINLLLQGYLPEAQEKLRKGMLDPRISLDESVASAVLVASYIHSLYESDSLEQAVAHFDQYRVVIKNAALLDYMALSYIAMARIFDARGDSVRAQEYLDELEGIAYASGWPRMLRNVNWERVRRAVINGEIDRANSIASRIPEEQDSGTTRWISFSEDTEGDAIGRIRLAIANADSELALQLVREFLPEARNLRLVRREIKLRILESMALRSSGQHQLAHQAMKEALRLAAQGGFVRIFLEEGSAAVKLLREVAETIPVWSGAVAAKPPDKEDRSSHEHLHRILRGSGLTGDGENMLEGERFEPLDPLSNREIQILALVANGASNRAIAEALFVSENTIKFHLKNIYSKLAVTGRAQAIHAAHQMGMI